MRPVSARSWVINALIPMTTVFLFGEFSSVAVHFSRDAFWHWDICKGIVLTYGHFFHFHLIGRSLVWLGI